jgi:hypothetical protein
MDGNSYLMSPDDDLSTGSGSGGLMPRRPFTVVMVPVRLTGAKAER